jgi:hypothetical protein
MRQKHYSQHLSATSHPEKSPRNIVPPPLPPHPHPHAPSKEKKKAREKLSPEIVKPKILRNYM